MGRMRIEQMVLGMVSTNCYLLINDELKQCVVVDPADNGFMINSRVNYCGCSLSGILLTHGHFDHITGALDVKNEFNAKIYASEEEKEVLATPSYNLSDSNGRVVTLEADVWHKDGDILKLAGFDIQVINTPGHTKGSCCYYIKDEGMLISGDTLFAQSVGRTDFPTGSMSQIVHSVNEKLCVLPDETKVLPGHGESSTIAYEKKYNPYVENNL